MNNKKFWIVVALMIIGLALMIWGSVIMNNYPGYREIRKEAIHAARYQTYFGIGIFLFAYILTFRDKWTKW